MTDRFPPALRLRTALVATAAIAGVPAAAQAARIATVGPKLAPRTQGAFPAVAMNDSGRAVAVWRNALDEPVARAAVRSSSGVWGPPVVIGTNAYAIRPAVGPRGDIAVVWQSPNGMWLASRPAGTTRWQRRRLSSTWRDLVLHLAVDGRGRATVLVKQDLGTQFAQRMTVRVFQGSVRSTTATWRRTIKPLSIGLGAEPTMYGLDVSPTGVAALIWRTSAGVVEVARTRGTSAWEAPVTLATSVDAAVDVAVNRGGDTAAVWSVRTGETWTSTTAMIRPLSFGSWPTTRIAIPDGVEPRVALSAGRRLVLTGGAKDPVLGQVLRVASKTSTGTWSVTSTKLGGCACEPSIWRAQFDAAGNLFVAGVLETSTTNTLATKGFVTAIPKNGTTAVAPVVYPVLGSTVFPAQVEAAGIGRGVVVWGRVNRGLAPVRVWSLQLTP